MEGLEHVITCIKKSKNHYDTIGVAPNAPQSEIIRGFRQRSLLLHPDKNPGTEEFFKTLNQAYEVLKDPDARQEYDIKLRQSMQPPSNTFSQGFGNHFNSVFNFFNFFGQRGTTTPNGNPNNDSTTPRDFYKSYTPPPSRAQSRHPSSKHARSQHATTQSASSQPPPSRPPPSQAPPFQPPPYPQQTSYKPTTYSFHAPPFAPQAAYNDASYGFKSPPFPASFPSNPPFKVPFTSQPSPTIPSPFAPQQSSFAHPFLFHTYPSAYRSSTTDEDARSTASTPHRKTTQQKKKEVINVDEYDGIDVTNILPGDRRRKSKVEAIQKNRAQTLNDLKAKRQREDERVEGMSRKRSKQTVDGNDDLEATSSRKGKRLRKLNEEEEEAEEVEEVGGDYYSDEYDSDESDSEIGEECKVEKIVEKRVRNGKIKYKVRWEGSGPEEDEWVNIEDCSCDDKIAAFEEQYRNNSNFSIETDEEEKVFSNMKKKRKMDEDYEDYSPN